MLTWTDSELLVAGFCNRFRAGGFFSSKAIEMCGGELYLLPPSLHRRDH